MTGAMHKECKKYFGKISQYLDGELDAQSCEKIRQHLLACPECRHCVDSLRKTIDICRNMPKEEIPEEIRKNLLQTLRDAFSDKFNPKS
jgi:RNA polymerase sigma-70 factor (ECF subfamily)